MASEESGSVTNRDAPIPVVSITDHDDTSSSASGAKTPTTPVNRPKHQRMLSAGSIRDRLGTLGERLGMPESPSSMSDRMFNIILQQVLSTEDMKDEPARGHHSRSHASRPDFSLATMSTNFRRFNARIGVAFKFQAKAIRLFSWRHPTHTFSFLAIYTFLILNPSLLPILPLALILFFVMVPSFLARHPPPPSTHPTHDLLFYPLAGGPPLAPAQNIRPAPELSKDFFRNMRDLQNCMEDFSRVHDALIAFLAPPTNFSNEALSTLLYLLLTCTCCLLFLTAHLIPWRVIFLLIGYLAIFSSHPRVIAFLDATSTPQKLSEQETKSRSLLLSTSKSDILLSASPEIREVEIFELQHRTISSLGPPPSDFSASSSSATITYTDFEPHTFSPHPYVPLSPARISGSRPHGTPFFEDVRPPRGWRWSDKKWTLDLLSSEWVEERCITGVEVEVEGERWVTDLLYEGGGHHHHHGSGGGAGEALNDAMKSPDDDGAWWKESKITTTAAAPSGNGAGNGTTSENAVGKKARNIWEEGRGKSKLGEWRRRRWVRGVERIPFVGEDG